MFKLRKATGADAIAITIVNVYTWQTAYAGLIPEDVLKSRINNLPISAEKLKNDISNRNIIVATVDDTIIGYCAYGVSRNENFSNCGEVYALYLLQGYQGNGIGKALFNRAMSELVTQGHAQVIVNCLQNNKRAMDFYKAMSGDVVGERQDEVTGLIITEDILIFST